MPFLAMAAAHTVRLDEKVLDGIVLARKLANACPSSLSVDDLQEPGRSKSPWFAVRDRTFVKPISKVSVVRDEKSAPAPIQSTRFSWLFGQSTKQVQPTDNVAMEYELPNTETLSPHAKGCRTVRVVTLATRSARSAEGSSCDSE